VSVQPASTAVDAAPVDGRRPVLDSLGAADRLIRAAARRTVEGDGGLAELAAAARHLAETGAAINAMARHLLAAEEASYKEIGAALDISAQAAAKRYPGASARRPGGQPSHLL
jgi:hypothetical protein